MIFQYTVDPSAETPIMLINKHIGYDEEMGMGIMGSQFQEELLALDAAGKRQVDVWLNTTGGSVIEACSIVGAMLHTKCRVDTYNMGICASSGAVIFQAGRKRIMCDYSKLMYHNTSGGSSDILKQMNDLVATIVAVRSETQIDTIKKMMERTTWIGALEAKAMNLCDEVKSSSDTNRGRLARASNDGSEIWKEANLILNSLIQKPLKMSELSKVNNKLGLIDEASQESTLKAIESIQNKIVEKDNEIKELNTTVNSLKGELSVLKTEKEAAEKAAVAAKEESDTKIALDTVNNYVKLGKVANEEETITAWCDTIKAIGLDKAKAMLEKLPINKNGAAIKTEEQAKTPDGVSVISRTMAEIRNKMNI